MGFVFESHKLKSTIGIYASLILLLSYSYNISADETEAPTTQFGEISNKTFAKAEIIHHECWGAPVHVFKAEKKQNATVIFLHDIGEDGNYWNMELESFRQPYIKVICPESQEMNVTWNDGMSMTSWFDFERVDKKKRLMKINDGIKKSAKYVHYLIDQEIKDGVKPSQIIVAGYQQGALMALYSGLTCSKKLGGIIAMSPWHPLPIHYDENLYGVNKNISVYVAGSEGNPYETKFTPMDTVTHLKKEFTSNVKLKMYRGAHFEDDTYFDPFDYKEFVDASAFVKKIFGAKSK